MYEGGGGREGGQKKTVMRGFLVDLHVILLCRPVVRAGQNPIVSTKVICIQIMTIRCEYSPS